MIKNKNKNKLARKIILSTLTFSSLVGVGLSALFTNGVNLKEEKLVNNQENSKIEEKSIGTTRAATTIVQKPGIVFNDYYPFELPIPAVGSSVAKDDPFWTFFEIQNGFPLDANIKYTISTVNLKNRSDNPQGGIYSFSGLINKSYDAAGNTIDIPMPLTLSVEGMRSVTAPTGIIKSTTNVANQNEYASDNIGVDGNAIRFLEISNGITSKHASNSAEFDTTLDVVIEQITYNNKNGTLSIPAELRNYINSDAAGKFMSYKDGPKPATATNISGFKQIAGITRFIAKQPAASATNPTTLLKNAASDGSLSAAFQDQYFTLENPLTFINSAGILDVGTKLVIDETAGKTGFVISEPDDIKGTLKVTLTVTGGYYGEKDGNLLPMRPETPTAEQKFSFIVDGFSKFVDTSGDDLTLVIAGIGGGVAFIAIVIALIFFIRFQKKKNEQVRKKKSMEDKLYTMSNTPKKGPGIANSAGIAPGGTAPGRAPGGPQAPGKYVPPTISVPKSNAPVVKRPSAPTGPSAGSTPPPMVKK